MGGTRGTRARRRLAALQVALGLPLASSMACGDAGAFELVDFDFEDDRSLVLTFSKPLAPVAEVDPAAFRISLSRSRTELTQYYEPGSVGLVEDCLEQCFFDDVIQQEICEQLCPGTPAEIAVENVANAEHDHRLLLGLSHAIGKPQCDWIDGNRDDNWEAGFTVHYDAERQPAVRSRDGEPLPSIMAQWVEAADFEEVDDRFPSNAPVNPIPCPH